MSVPDRTLDRVSRVAIDHSCHRLLVGGSAPLRTSRPGLAVEHEYTVLAAPFPSGRGRAEGTSGGQEGSPE